MKATGVVRRVDDLGRIVIPKEIRRNLRIRDGEDLEIFVDNDIIILKKFSKIAELCDVSKKIIAVASSLIGKTILVTDRDTFISGCGDLKKKYLNKKISKNLEKFISDANIVVQKNVDNILFSDVSDVCSYIVNPIISFGDVVGTVIILSSNSDISEFDINIVNMIAQFLGKYVED